MSVKSAVASSAAPVLVERFLGPASIAGISPEVLCQVEHDKAERAKRSRLLICAAVGVVAFAAGASYRPRKAVAK